MLNDMGILADFLLTLGFFVAAHIGRTAKNQVAA